MSNRRIDETDFLFRGHFCGGGWVGGCFHQIAENILYFMMLQHTQPDTYITQYLFARCCQSLCELRYT